MKLVTYIVVLCMLQVSAQKDIYQEIAYQHQEIDMQLLDVDIIEITHTDEAKIAITMQDYAENSTRLKIEENSKIITIKASILTPFQQKIKTEKYCYVQPLFPSFKITIPKGCTITINYDKGNFKATNFEGNLNLSLDTGDVQMNNFKGSINAELLSGNMNVSMENTIVDVQSNKGTIQTNFPTADWQRTKTSLKGTYGKNTNALKVLTIHANIKLKATTTQ